MLCICLPKDLCETNRAVTSSRLRLSGTPAGFEHIPALGEDSDAEIKAVRDRQVRSLSVQNGAFDLRTRQIQGFHATGDSIPV